MIRVSPAPFDPAEELRLLDGRGAGAIVSFTGHVRAKAGADTVTGLYLQAYPEMTEPGIAEAADRARMRWPLEALRVIHRTGTLLPGEPIVFVGAASAHRRAAFQAVDYLMDYLKTEAIFWKKEITLSGERWIEPREEDHRDRNRWTED